MTQEGGNTGTTTNPRWCSIPFSSTPSCSSRIGSTLSLLSFLHYDKHSNKGGWCCFQQQHARHLPIPLQQCQYSTTAKRTPRRIGILYYAIATTRRRQRRGSAPITTLPPLVDGDEEDWLLYYDIATTRRRRRGGLASIITITFTTLPPLVDGDEEDRHLLLPSLLRHCHHSSTATRRIGIYYYHHFYDIATTRRRRQGGLASILTITFRTLPPLVDDFDQLDRLTPLVDGDEADTEQLLYTQ
jgi:hypothetical protein